MSGQSWKALPFAGDKKNGGRRAATRHLNFPCGNRYCCKQPARRLSSSMFFSPNRKRTLSNRFTRDLDFSLDESIEANTPAAKRFPRFPSPPSSGSTSCGSSSCSFTDSPNPAATPISLNSSFSSVSNHTPAKSFPSFSSFSTHTSSESSPLRQQFHTPSESSPPRRQFSGDGAQTPSPRRPLPDLVSCIVCRFE